MAERPQGYGFTAEVAARQEAKRDPAREGKAKAWLQALAGEPFPAGSFQEALKDGVYLCKAINKLSPGAVKKINTSKMAFKMMENIGNFLSGCEAYGLAKADLFQTVDLYEDQNIPLVVDCIHALGRKARAKGYSGPGLGPKEAAKNERFFDSEQQKKAGQSVIGLQMGTNRGASQAGMTAYGQQRQVYDPKQK